MPAAPTLDLVVGTYTRTTSRGLYAVALDPASGTLSSPRLVAELANPTWIATHPGGRFLYAITEIKTDDGPAAGAVQAFALDRAAGALTPLNLERTAASLCHAAVDATGRCLVAVSYGGGQVSSFPLRADGTVGPRRSFIQHTGTPGPNSARQDKPHAHSATISPDNRFVLVADLGLDRVFIYALDADTATLTPAVAPYSALAPGSGPRHGKFSPSGGHFYVNGELDSSVTVAGYDTFSGALTPIQRVTTLPEGFSGPNITAEIRVHPTGRFLYVSNRGHDSLAAYAIAPVTGALSPIEISDAGGATPRNFGLSPDGAWLVVAHQGSDTLCAFAVDPITGRLTRVAGAVAVPQPVCVLFAS